MSGAQRDQVKMSLLDWPEKARVGAVMFANISPSERPSLTETGIEKSNPYAHLLIFWLCSSSAFSRTSLALLPEGPSV